MNRGDTVRIVGGRRSIRIIESIMRIKEGKVTDAVFAQPGCSPKKGDVLYKTLLKTLDEVLDENGIVFQFGFKRITEID